MSAQNEYGTANTWEFDTDTPVQNGWYNYFSQFMQIEECTNVPIPSLYTPCYSSKTKIKSLYKGNLQYGITWTHGGKLNNGMYVLFHTNYINYRSYGNIVVDINGEKGPNTYGKDIFSFQLMIEKDWARNQIPKIKPEGLYKWSDGSLTDDTTDECLTSGNACTGWIMRFNNVDYLHCKDYLLKTGEHSCKK